MYYRMHFMCYFSISLILMCCMLKVLPSSSASRLNDEERFKRRERESVLDYYIDITVYVDYTAYSRFLNHAFLDQGLALKNIKDYYGFIIDGVDKIYRDSVRNKFNLHVKLSQLVVFKDPEMFPLTYISTSSNKLEPIEVQTNFTEFLLRNDSTKGTNPYDFAILFIEADLWINNREVKGISYFGRMCSDDGTSSSVVEDMGDYYCIYTTARALAVSMSATIDGVYNNCSSEDFYLMSNQFSNITDSSVLNPWKLSNCTIESIVMFISSLENTSSSRHACLLNTTVTHVPDVSPRLLGQEIYPDKQCQLKYGQTSYDCQRKNMTSNICTHMFCFDPSRSTCLRQLPLHGTTCGCGKICNQGACVDDQIFQNIDCGVTNAWSNCTLDSCLNKAGGSELCPHTCITYLTYLAYLAKPPRVVNFTVNGQKSVYLRDDDNADFFCEVDGIPTPTAYLNGSFLSKIHDLSNSSHIVSSSLTSVSCEDSGRYFCYGRNGHENTSSFEADYVDINVTCKPRLLPSEAKYENESKVVRISFDTNTVFTVIIYGYPAPTQFILKVEKDNVFQDLTVHHEVTYTKLTPPFGRVNVTIYDANTKETKTYNLNIKNEAGMVDIKFNVIKEESGPTSGGDDVGMKIGIGVGVGLGVLLLAAVIIVTVCIVRRRRLKKTPRQPPPQFFNPAFDKPEFHKKRQINLETDYIN